MSPVPASTSPFHFPKPPWNPDRSTATTIVGREPLNLTGGGTIDLNTEPLQLTGGGTLDLTGGGSLDLASGGDVLEIVGETIRIPVQYRPGEVG